MKKLIKLWKHKRRESKRQDPQILAQRAHEWRELSLMLLQELIRHGTEERKESIDGVVEEFRKRKAKLEL